MGVLIPLEGRDRSFVSIRSRLGLSRRLLVLLLRNSSYPSYSPGSARFVDFRDRLRGSGVSEGSVFSVKGSSLMPASQPSIRLPKTLGAEVVSLVPASLPVLGVLVLILESPSTAALVFLRLTRRDVSSSSAVAILEFLPWLPSLKGSVEGLSFGAVLGRGG